MIMVMENAALNAIKPYLDPSESAVGTEINVRHLAPTVVGSIVTGEAEVTKIDGRRMAHHAIERATVESLVMKLYLRPPDVVFGEISGVYPMVRVLKQRWYDS